MLLMGYSPQAVANYKTPIALLSNDRLDPCKA